MISNVNSIESHAILRGELPLLLSYAVSEFHGKLNKTKPNQTKKRLRLFHYLASSNKLMLHFAFSGCVTGADMTHSFRSIPPLTTVAIFLNRLDPDGGTPMLCKVIRSLLGQEDSGMFTASLGSDMLRPNSRILVGAVETTRDVKNGKLANMISSVDSEV